MWGVNFIARKVCIVSAFKTCVISVSSQGVAPIV